jgi:hypothetical protein
VEEDQVDDADADTTNELQELELSGTVLGLSKSSKTVILPSSGGGDNWGTQVVQTDTTLTGEGTDASPLGIIHTAVTPEWDNIQGIPEGFADGIDDADDADSDTLNEIQTLLLTGTQLTLSKEGGTVTLPSSGSGGDNWGTDVVHTDATLEGEGTTAVPLKIAQQSAATGQVLKWDGSKWTPDADDDADDDSDAANELQDLSAEGNTLKLSGSTATVDLSSYMDNTDSQTLSITENNLSISGGNTVTLPSSGGGDNWGSDYVHTDATLEGQGTTTLPLKIARQSATTGQVLKWSGSTWSPANDDSGGDALSLPYSGSASFASDPVFDITNTGNGSGIKGKSNATSGVYYGVIGESSSENGTGVYGSAPKTGVEGIAHAGGGTAIYGYAYDSQGTNYGIRGVTNSANGYSGFFQGGKFHISGNTGIGTANPTAKLEVNGQIKITGGSPGSGKMLISDANGLASWQPSPPWIFDENDVFLLNGNLGLGTVFPAARLDVATSQGPNLIIRDSDGGSGRPGIQFSNNNIHYIAGDDGSEEVFGIYADYGNNRTYAAKLNVHGPASSSWGRYIGLTHDGSHGRIYTDAGYLVLEPAGQRIGVGTDAPTQNLDVNGNARFRAIGSGAYSGVVNRTSDGTLTTATSDERLKENICKLQNNLDKVMLLQGVSFTWKSDPEYGRRIGFIAQEFEKVVPELVFTNEFDGYKGINYAELTAVIVEAIKEQQEIIEYLKTENDRLKAENNLNTKELRKMKEETHGLTERIAKMETFLGSTVHK